MIRDKGCEGCGYYVSPEIQAYFNDPLEFYYCTDCNNYSKHTTKIKQENEKLNRKE